MEMWETQKNDGTEREAQEGGGSRVGGVPVANRGGGGMVGSKIERKRREQILLQVSQSQRRGSVNQRETGCDVRVVKVRGWEHGGQSGRESRGKILRLPVLLCLSVRQRLTPRVPRSSPASPGKPTSNCAGALLFFPPEQLCELKAAGTGRLLYQPFGMTSLRALLLPAEE